MLSIYNNQIIPHDRNLDYILDVNLPKIDVRSYANKEWKRLIRMEESNGRGNCSLYVTFKNDISFHLCKVDNFKASWFEYPSYEKALIQHFKHYESIGGNIWGLDENNNPIIVSIEERVKQELTNRFILKIVRIKGGQFVLARFRPKNESQYSLEYSIKGLGIDHKNFNTYIELIRSIPNIGDYIGCVSCPYLYGKYINREYFHCAPNPKRVNVNQCSEWKIHEQET